MRIARTHTHTSLSPNLKIRLQKITVFSVPPLAALILFLIMFIPCSSSAKVTGPCVNCHTMHNSQDGGEMATYGGETGPNSFLVRGSCIGCHAQGGSSKIITIGGSQIPQVYHTDDTDLAGGNFRHIGVIGDGVSADADRGHNVIDLFGVNSDGDLNGYPGPIKIGEHVWSARVTDYNLTCAGEKGCHGTRRDDTKAINALKGAHHGNEDGQLDSADSVSNSYRFLLGVKGLENPNPTDRWQNVSAGSHNEYYGATAPLQLGCGSGDFKCHGPLWGSGMIVLPPGNTISGFCGTCHGNFHELDEIWGIGGDAFSPFRRHPNDILIKDSGEYAVDKRVYDSDAPVGRTSVPASVITGATTNDVVTCLSCHAAHATENPDMLRWDYSGMIAGGEGSGGCFTCHTQKND